MKIITLLNKQIRSEVIKKRYGGQRVVCFSCGNATDALEAAGVNVISVSPRSSLAAQNYIPPKEVERMFNAPDVTSGNLPPYLMLEIGKRFNEALRLFLDDEEIVSRQFIVPCGSGETIMALANFIPLQNITGYYSPFIPAINFTDWSPYYWFLKMNVRLMNIGKVAPDKTLELIETEAPLNSVLIATKEE